jgi:hypothetical protein
MEATAGRLCVAILADRQPSAAAHAFWPPVHGEARVELPALEEFLDLLRARGRDPKVDRFPRPARGFATREELAAWLRNQLFLEEGSTKDLALARAVAPHVIVNADGTIRLVPEVPMSTGVVTWEPR